MKQYCAGILFLLIAVSLSAANPSADEIVNKALDALGGKANLEKVETKTGSAKVEVRGLTGTYNFWAKAPDKLKTALDLGVLQQERAYDGTAGWQKQNSVQELAGSDLDRMKRSAVFNALLQYSNNKTPAAVKGKESVNGVEAYRVEFTPAPEQTETFFFDTKTFLPVREVRNVVLDLQKMDLIVDYSDYRKVETILLPFTTVQTLGDQVLSLKFDSYQINASIDEMLFKNPTEQFASEPYDVNISTIPEHVYKENDGVWEDANTESWFFHVVVHEKHGRPLQAVAARIEFFSEDDKAELMEFSSSALDEMRGTSFGGFNQIDEVFDLRFQFSRPSGEEIDKMVLKLNLVNPKNEKIQKELTIPVLEYEQHAKLIFPIKGKFVVGAGHDYNEPHKEEWSQEFAYDIVGLGDHYEITRGDSKENKDFLGFAREIIAPADGKVVFARNDVPENKMPGTIDSDVFLKMPDPERAFPGNNVIIDHGNNEFSAFCHLKFGSVLVKEGDSVKQGQVIGLLGNSGNSDAPHLHYQLMSGPKIFHSDSLPSVFENVFDEDLTSDKLQIATPKRGVYLIAK